MQLRIPLNSGDMQPKDDDVAVLDLFDAHGLGLVDELAREVVEELGQGSSRSA